MKNILPILAMMLMLTTACKTTKYAPEKLPVRQVVFGDGGGFVGIETTYTLLENGQIFKQVGVEGAFQELKAIKPKAAKALFDKVNSLQLFKLDVDKPGNMYYYLRQITDHLDSRVTWGAGDYTPPPGLVSVYKELKALTKDRASVTSKKSDKKDADPTDKKEDTTKPAEDSTKW